MPWHTYEAKKAYEQRTEKEQRPYKPLRTFKLCPTCKTMNKFWAKFGNQCFACGVKANKAFSQERSA